MQNPVVVIGGLEKSYMQKLALYLNTRIGKDGYVELLEGSDRQMDLLGSSGKQMELLESSGRQIDSVREDMRLQNVRHQREKHWELAVGSEAFVVALQEAGQAEQILILTDTEEEDETHISQYQIGTVSEDHCAVSIHCQCRDADGGGKEAALDCLYRWKPGKFDGSFRAVCLDSCQETTGVVCGIFGKQWSGIGISTGVWNRRYE